MDTPVNSTKFSQRIIKSNLLSGHIAGYHDFSMVNKSKISSRKPLALDPGDRIELVAPASPFSLAEMKAGAQVLRDMGFVPVWNDGVFAKNGFFAGTDKQRAKNLERAIYNKDTKAIWSIRGGYGTARIMGMLDKKSLASCNKLLVGFSDVSSLLLNMYFNHGLVTIHGPVITQLPRIPKTHLQWLKSILTNTRAAGKVPLGRTRVVCHGSASGILAGGNLSILASLSGTWLMPNFKGCIVFLEDVAEQAYALDRKWQQLVQSGCLRGVRGLVLGELTRCKPAAGSRWSARKVMERALAELGVPAISGAAFGHGKANIALPVGVRAKLNTQEHGLVLLDPVVR